VIYIGVSAGTETCLMCYYVQCQLNRETERPDLTQRDRSFSRSHEGKEEEEALCSTAERGDSADPVQQGSRECSRAGIRASSWESHLSSGPKQGHLRCDRVKLPQGWVYGTLARVRLELKREPHWHVREQGRVGVSREGGERVRQERARAVREQKGVEGERERERFD
jgi:hypothetical protein